MASLAGREQALFTTCSSTALFHLINRWRKCSYNYVLVYIFISLPIKRRLRLSYEGSGGEVPKQYDNLHSNVKTIS